jgi:hypothetical protein
MFSLVFSICWVCLSSLTMLVKACLLQASKSEVQSAKDKALCAAHTLTDARRGHKLFIVGSIIGFALLFLIYALGIIKWWVVMVDCIFWVCSLIMNIVHLGFLKRNTNDKAKKAAAMQRSIGNAYNL